MRKNQSLWKRLDKEYAKHIGNFDELFLSAKGRDIIRGFLLPAVTANKVKSRPIAQSSIKSLCDKLIPYGLVDGILTFVLFLKRVDEEGVAVQKFYDILGEKAVFGKPVKVWCDEFLAVYSETEAEEDLGDFTLTPATLIPQFVAERMLEVPATASTDQAMEIVADKVKQDGLLSKYAISELGWLQYVYKLRATDAEFVGKALKRLLTNMNDNPVDLVYQSALLKAYVEAALAIHTNAQVNNSNLYAVSGLGKLICDFTEDREKKHCELLKDLEANASGLWKNFLYFSVCQANYEGDYETAAKLLIRHYDYARSAKQAQMRKALLSTYMNVADPVSALALFSLIKWEQRRCEVAYQGEKFTSKENVAIDKRFGEIVRAFVDQSQAEITSIKNQATESASEFGEPEQIEVLQTESDRYASVTSLFPQATFFETKLYDSMRQFQVANRLPERDLFECLGDEERATVISYLRQGEMIFSLFEMLQKDRQGEEFYDGLDYSPAVLQLTKALEYIANLIYHKIDLSLLPLSVVDVPQDPNLTHIRGYKDSITIGDFKYLFSRRTYGTLVRPENNMDAKVYLSDLLDMNAYRRKDTRKPHVDSIYQDVEEVRKLRNSAAHKDKVEPDKYTKCERLMMTDYANRQYLLWNLLYIVKPGIQFGDKK